jgi:hypothetical protein
MVDLVFQHPTHSWLGDEDPHEDEEVDEVGNEGAEI